jgi:hypothetical protein
MRQSTSYRRHLPTNPDAGRGACATSSRASRISGLAGSSRPVAASVVIVKICVVSCRGVIVGDRIIIIDGITASIIPAFVEVVDRDIFVGRNESLVPKAGLLMPEKMLEAFK